MKLLNSNLDETKNFDCDETKKNEIVIKLKNSNCDETKKNQTMMKLKNLNSDETHLKL